MECVKGECIESYRLAKIEYSKLLVYSPPPEIKAIKMECPICHEAISATTGITTLSCSHSFHINCIGSWFISLEKGTCPCCRKEMTTLEDLDHTKFDEKERMAEEMLEEATREVSEMLEGAEAEIKDMLSEAKAAAEKMILTAKADADKIIKISRSRTIVKRSTERIWPSPATIVWVAYVKRCTDTIPEIAALSKQSERVKAIKTLRDSNRDAYNAFSAEWHRVNPIIV